MRRLRYNGIFKIGKNHRIGEERDVDICIKTITPNPFLLAHIKEEIERRFKNMLISFECAKRRILSSRTASRKMRAMLDKELVRSIPY
jgi:hypothetical protein